MVNVAEILRKLVGESLGVVALRHRGYNHGLLGVTPVHLESAAYMQGYEAGCNLQQEAEKREARRRLGPWRH